MKNMKKTILILTYDKVILKNFCRDKVFKHGLNCECIRPLVGCVQIPNMKFIQKFLSFLFILIHLQTEVSAFKTKLYKGLLDCGVLSVTTRSSGREMYFGASGNHKIGPYKEELIDQAALQRAIQKYYEGDFITYVELNTVLSLNTKFRGLG